MKQSITMFAIMVTIGIMSAGATTAVFAQTNGNPHDFGEAGNPHDLPNCSGNPHDNTGIHHEHNDDPGSPGCPGAQ
jgi:hypothetical protein